MRGTTEFRRVFTLAGRAYGSGGRPGFRGARARWQSEHAFGQDFLVAALWYAHRPFRDRMDGQRRNLRIKNRSMTNVIYPRSPRELMAGWVYLPRFVDKIRLHLAGKLDPDYQENF